MSHVNCYQYELADRTYFAYELQIDIEDPHFYDFSLQFLCGVGLDCNWQVGDEFWLGLFCFTVIEVSSIDERITCVLDDTRAPI